jgi:hypothetical protein
LQSRGMTAGGLVIHPKMEFFEGDELPSLAGEPYELVKGDPRGDNFVEYNNPEWSDPLAEGEFEDSVFNWPFRFTVDFLDPKTDFRPPLPGANGWAPNALPKTKLIDMDSSKTLTKWSSKFGPNTNPTQLSDMHVLDILTDLMDKAGEHLATGAVDKSDVIELAKRDIGVYEGDESMNILTPSTMSKQGFEKVGTPLMECMIDEFQKAHALRDSDDPPTIDDIVNNTMARMKPEFEKYGLVQDSNYDGLGSKYSTAHEMTCQAFMSTLVHGIKDTEFYPEVLTALQKHVPQTVKHILGEDAPMRRDFMLHTMRALPYNSPHMKTLISNHYRHIC